MGRNRLSPVHNWDTVAREDGAVLNAADSQLIPCNHLLFGATCYSVPVSAAGLFVGIPPAGWYSTLTSEIRQQLRYRTRGYPSADHQF